MFRLPGRKHDASLFEEFELADPVKHVPALMEPRAAADDALSVLATLQGTL